MTLFTCPTCGQSAEMLEGSVATCSGKNNSHRVVAMTAKEDEMGKMKTMAGEVGTIKAVKAAEEKREAKRHLKPVAPKAERKTCSRCKTERPISDFPTNKTSKDGHSHWCAACFVAYRQERKAKTS